MCSNLLDNCTKFWKDIVNLHDTLISFKLTDTVSSQENVKSLKDAINDKFYFWKAISEYHRRTPQSTKSELCSSFFNVLDYTPKILQSSKISSLFHPLNNNRRRRLLTCTDSKNRDFKHNYIGEPEVDFSVNIFTGGCN